MHEIQTTRLNIIPTHKNCWSIHDRIDDALIGKLFFRDHWFNIILKPKSLRLGVASEASFALMKAINNDHYQAKSALPHAQQFLKELGFKPHKNHFEVTIEALCEPDLYQSLNKKLNINPTLLKTPKYHTTAQLVDSDIDCFNRPTKLHPKANQAWQKMRRGAQADGVNLQLVSAFRSMGYQAGIIQMKLDQGNKLVDILTTNTAPGHSEHHTGCAIDITTTDYPPLEQAFENSTAFKWLTEKAADFNFTLSYPKDNVHGIIYEPWHWCYQFTQDRI